MGRNKENILYDFGKVTIPERWEEVTLEQFTKIMRISDGKKGTDARELIAILADKDKEWVNMLPAKFVQSLMVKLVFLHKAPEKKSSNEIIIDGERYRINFSEELKFGEYVDVNTLIQADSLNYAGFLAILCRKPDEKYDDEFTSHIDERVALFNRQPVTDVLPIIAFFLNLWALTENFSQDFLKEMEEQANQLLLHIEDSRKSGDYKELPISSRVRISLWLRRFRKCLRQVSSNT